MARRCDMKKLLNFAGIMAGLAIVTSIAIVLLMPWMDRWGATSEEISASFPGDELVPSAQAVYNRAVTIYAAPEEIYPWLVQMGAEKGGMYSYSWLETKILHCELINADRIHEEWQNLQVGDKVKMCPGNWGPPAYEVALLDPNHAVVIGHQTNGTWGDVWQFTLIPQADDTTRLIARGRTRTSGGIWNVIRPGQFIMERGMLLGIKQRAESTKNGVSSLVTPTQEIFNPLRPSPTPSGSILPLT